MSHLYFWLVEAILYNCDYNISKYVLVVEHIEYLPGAVIQEVTHHPGKYTRGRFVSSRHGHFAS